MIELIVLGQQNWAADGLNVTRSRASVHELTTEKHLDINNYSIGKDFIAKVLLEVCRTQCSAFAQCYPEAIVPKGWLDTTPAGIKGAQVHTDNCILVDTFIPDKEFRKD